MQKFKEPYHPKSSIQFDSNEFHIFSRNLLTIFSDSFIICFLLKLIETKITVKCQKEE